MLLIQLSGSIVQVSVLVYNIKTKESEKLYYYTYFITGNYTFL